MNLTRRQFVTALGCAALFPTACSRGPRRDRVGIALGGGGARGLAHVLMLEVLDELGIKPYRIAGTSIGAIIGVLYAAGKSGREIRALIDQLTVSENESWIDALSGESGLRWLDFLLPELRRGGLLNPDGFIAFLDETLGVERFDQLKIPLQVVATDFWSREAAVFDSGLLMPAVQASMALPGVFAPVTIGDRLLVDGGLVNPVPYDLIQQDCDLTIAVDVIGLRTPGEDPIPSYLEATFEAFQILQSTVLKEKMRHRPPDIYIRPEIRDVRVLEFYKFEAIFQQAQPQKDRLKRQLEKLLG
ncbi:MAG: patatin-like phospholipase family protein [Proteobacteria bacterium]|nr:MAG: patatin-like phospholipase family protein [Pseudomonadota bacterium]QKK10718.1 MAG: patatin-like phospholipase family protein [Pseudomonadota bacterium]